MGEGDRVRWREKERRSGGEEEEEEQDDVRGLIDEGPARQQDSR